MYFYSKNALKIFHKRNFKKIQVGYWVLPPLNILSDISCIAGGGAGEFPKWFDLFIQNTHPSYLINTLTWSGRLGRKGSQDSVSNKGYSRLKRILLFCLVSSSLYFESAILSYEVWCTEWRLNCYSKIPQKLSQAQVGSTDFKCWIPSLTMRQDILMLTSGRNTKIILDTHRLRSRKWTSHIMDCARSSEKNPSGRALSATPPRWLSGHGWNKHCHSL